MIITDRDSCTGCGACVQACPVGCIDWTSGELGFQYPLVDETRCVSCGKCTKVCPANRKGTEKPAFQRAYSAVHRDKDVLQSSASGGAFAALAEYTLAKNGVIYGSAMQPDMRVEHIRIERREQTAKLQGSKYVQSDTKRTFAEAEQDLKAGRLVLYTGCPCQIAGLKAFLGSQYENLLTADLVCHGVPSQAYFSKFIEGIERDKNISVKNYSFRSKKNKGWALSGEMTYSDSSGTTKVKPIHYSDHYYYYYYLRTSIYRKSCYSCPYSSLLRPGDFTLGDLWGAEGMRLKLNIKNGCSLLLTNNERADELLPALNMDVAEITIEDAVKHNKQLRAPSLMSPDRGERIREFEQEPAEAIQKKFRNENKKGILFAKAKNMVPPAVRNVLLAIRYRT